MTHAFFNKRLLKFRTNFFSRTVTGWFTVMSTSFLFCPPIGDRGGSLWVTAMQNERTPSQLVQGLLCCSIIAQHTTPGCAFLTGFQSLGSLFEAEKKYLSMLAIMLTTLCMWTCKLLETIWSTVYILIPEKIPEQLLRVPFYIRADTITRKKPKKSSISHYHLYYQVVKNENEK